MFHGKIPAMTRYVYDFDEPSEGGKELLGGKGAGLAEMTALGVPVPAGFTITTDACRAYMAAGRRSRRSRGRDRAASRGARGSNRQALRRSGDPLLVSVRSGAAVSMPG
jgi:pyruvate,orthophosphate dikinase